MYDCGKFEIVDFINFVQCKGNCLLLRSEHYLERHIGRTQYFRINSYWHKIETSSPFPHTPTDVIPNFSDDNILNRLIYGHPSKAFRRRTEKEGERVNLTWSGLIWLCLRITG